MALIKKIGLENGIVVNYHRIVSMNIITNVHNVIEIGSYASEEIRQKEKNALESGNTTDVFVESTYIESEYDPNMTIESAYEYLKSFPVFKESIDV